jgi:hypothetical protein
MRDITAVLALLLAALGVASAQQMPDPSQMAGRPLPAPELPAGTVSVRLFRERVGNNIVNHPVTLSGLKAGPTTLSTDEQGRAQFSGIAPGTMVSAEAIVDGETLRSQQFPVPASGGIRVALVAGLEAARNRERADAEAAAKEPARPGMVIFGGESRIILEFQDDMLQVFYLLDVVNSAKTPITIPEPLVIELPVGAQGAGAMEGSSPLAMVQGDRIRISGPFPPGTTGVQLGYRFRYSGSNATLTQRWPAAIEQLFVAAEKVGNLQIASPQFESTRETQANGTPFLMATGGRVNAGDTLTITLSGLPYHNRIVRDVGLGAGLVILGIGLWIGTRRRPQGKNQTTQLEQRKEKLFGELVQLEEQRRTGRVDEARYASRRQTLMTHLERIMGELDRASDAPSGGGGEGVAA